MRGKKISIGLTAVLAIAAVALLVTGTRADAQTETVLLTFDNTNGAWPSGNLVFDAAGNLYGTSELRGAYGNGAVFELSPQAGGGWAQSVLHSFDYATKDGYYPYAGLIMDAAGNLYGTTEYGGAGTDGLACVVGSYQNVVGCGTVFELSPQAGGGWTEKVLHSFNNNGTDGTWPMGGLVLDAAGNLYGTTVYGGEGNCTGGLGTPVGCGAVFELTPAAGGTWKEKVLHSFNGDREGGLYPYSGLIFDGAGNLYGTTEQGAYGNNGAVFELSPKAGGGWVEKVLYSFKGGTKDGTSPEAGVVFDSKGNLYGTTVYGSGYYSYGTVFELSPKAGGGWTEKVLYSFTGGTDGRQPYAGLTFDSGDNLYGTTAQGGFSGAGVVFELTPKVGGVWTETVVYSFCSQLGCVDGEHPYAGVILDTAGNLYGTAEYGGSNQNLGTVFEITP
jgi:uncharacterized repeat protein (TIGR03803 family)